MNDDVLLGEKRPAPRVAIIVISLLILGIIALVILMGLERPESSMQVSAIEFVIATEQIHPSED